MSEKKKTGILDLLIYLYILIISVAVPTLVVAYKQGLFSATHELSISFIISNLINACILGVIFGLIIIISLIYHQIFAVHWNGDKSSSLFLAIMYSVALLMCAGSVYLSPYVFPFVFLTVYIMVLSDSVTAMACCMSFSTYSMLFNDRNPDIFLYIIISSFMAIIVWGIFSKPLKYVSKSFIVFFINLVIYLGVVLVNCYSLTPELVILPFVGMVINLICLLFSMRSYSKRKIEAIDEEFNRINDPEFELLIKLKEENKKEYHVAIHCAYLCDRMANMLNRNRTNAKILGYYHGIGILEDDNDSAEIGITNAFPAEIIELLKEYNVLNKKAPNSCEVVICKISDEIIRSIMIAMAEDPKNKPDYNRIIQRIFREKFESGFFDKCNLTMKEIRMIREHLQGEKLYYDFLR